ncbi:MAG TPA: FtsK/SpoIIIE domain-containing protein [Anaerolineaceae bacterium]|nr:FtsK/SpoIIIE domain-containing protein [Anaerolineaceae bacterium]HPN51918.1 FtsK/SpoIIIE domain-containing protein [Anaerolineaceae bacterium]
MVDNRAMPNARPGSHPGGQPVQNDRFNRPPRLQHPLPERKIVLPAPPVPQPISTRSVIAMILPGLGMLLSMIIIALLAFVQDRNMWTMLPTTIMAGVSIFSALYMYQSQAGTQKKAQEDQDKRFTTLIQIKMDELKRFRNEEKRTRQLRDPSIDEVRTLIEANDIRLWERRPTDPDFSALRLGVGTVNPTVVLELPENIDPMAPRYEETVALYEANRLLDDVPVTINLREVVSIGMWGGDRQTVLGRVYAMIIHMIAHHAPHELHIVLISQENYARDWDWLAWPEHTGPLKPDLPGRSMAFGLDAAQLLLNDLVGVIRHRMMTEDENKNADEVKTPHYVLIIDQYDMLKRETSASYLMENAVRAGITIIDIEGSGRDVPDICKARIEGLMANSIKFATCDANPVIFTCKGDMVSREEAMEMARMLTYKHQSRSTRTVANIPTNVRLIDALFAREGKTWLSVDEIDVLNRWQTRPDDQTWSILIGQKQNHEPVWLNLLEDRDGPHGLVAGTTGAGKSVLLQSVILSLALTHSPSEINLVLIDFKGGSTAEAFRDLPHTISVITNLQGRLVDRALAILKAEGRRRQKELAKVGYKDIATYHANMKKQNLPPFPRLVVVIDEFAEMAKAMPEFMTEINSLAAIGRSLGMHLILATQTPGGVISDKVWANLKFRICLRVATSGDSREMIGVPDASLLPTNLPGRCYIRVGADRLELFQAANTAYPYRSAETMDTTTLNKAKIVRAIGMAAGATPGKSRSGGQDASSRAVSGRTELEVVVERMMQLAPKAPQWPESLPKSLAIEELWREFSIENAWQWAPEAGRMVFKGDPALSSDHFLKVPVGLLDDPYKQERRPLWVDLQTQHYLIMGAPRSGRSTLIQSIVRTMIANATPDQLHIHILDFGGQSLAVFKDAPHVANILNVNTPIHLRRFLDQISDDIDYRIQMRATHQEGKLPHVLYIIDGFAELKSLFPDEILVFTRIAREGLGLNLHLIVAADQVTSTPMSLRNLCLGRLALHLSEAGDYSDLVGRVTGSLPDPLPGRGLVRERSTEPILEFQAALPMGQIAPDGGSIIPMPEDEMAVQIMRYTQELARGWGKPGVPGIEILPNILQSADMPAEWQPAGKTWTQNPGALPRISLGKDDRRLQWKPVDYASLGQPHFLVCGPAQSGKTNLLRLWLWSIAEKYSPAEVQMMVIGLRNRSLNSLADLPHVRMLVDNEFRLDTALAAIEDEAKQRYERLKKMAEADPNGDIGAMSASLGPSQIVVVDDFDTVRFPRDRQVKLVNFAKYGINTRTFLVVAGTSNDLQETTADLTAYFRRARSAFVLQPGELEVRITDIKLSNAALRQEYPVGRGYLMLGNKVDLIQTANLPEAVLAERAARLRALMPPA